MASKIYSKPLTGWTQEDMKANVAPRFEAICGYTPTLEEANRRPPLNSDS